MLHWADYKPWKGSNSGLLHRKWVLNDLSHRKTPHSSLSDISKAAAASFLLSCSDLYFLLLNSAPLAVYSLIIYNYSYTLKTSLWFCHGYWKHIVLFFHLFEQLNTFHVQCNVLGFLAWGKGGVFDKYKALKHIENLTPNDEPDTVSEERMHCCWWDSIKRRLLQERLGVQEFNELILVVEGTLKIYSIPRIHKPASWLLDQTTWLGGSKVTVVIGKDIVLVVKTNEESQDCGKTWIKYEPTQMTAPSLAQYRLHPSVEINTSPQATFQTYRIQNLILTRSPKWSEPYLNAWVALL